MTVHQLHYTSCEDGLEGIQGFQISAMTPGAPKHLVDMAVRASTYQVGPALMTRLDEDDFTTFPVAFGYVPSGPAAALFQSRYIGSDFTGRTGNYFAHALLLDNADAELNGVLPIDMWRSPAWVHTRQHGTSLPTVTALPAGGATDPAAILQFLREQDRYDRLARMIGAAQRKLGGGSGRLVLVVPDDHAAALWLAALCRSFPRSLGRDISFLTYTARPEDTTVLVCCTTPDVRLPTYGDFTAVDMTDAEASGDDPTRYATMLARLWENDGVRSSIQQAERVTPPLTAAELEAFAVFLECATGMSGGEPPTEALLLDAARIAIGRLPGTLTVDGWRQLGDLLTACAGPADLDQWSELLQSAGQEPVSARLSGAYYVAALAEPRRLWLPRLTAEELDDVAEHAVLTALTGDRPEAILDQLGEHRDLLDALVRVLQGRLGVHDEFHRLATTLTPKAARLLRSRGAADSRLALLIDLVLARDGQTDRVAVLNKAVPDTEWWRLGEVLWPADPSSEEASRAVRNLHVKVLQGTELHARIMTRLMRQVEQDQLGPEEINLVHALLDKRVVGVLQPADRSALGAVRIIDDFRRSTPNHEAQQAVRAGLAQLDGLPKPIGDRLLDSIAEFTLRVDGPPHRELLLLALEIKNRRFLATYREHARKRLAKATPNQVASMIVIWWSLPDNKIQQTLVNETLADAVAKRRAKLLDQVGDLLASTAKKLPGRVPTPKGGWPVWWKSWRSTHERRGLLGLLGLRKGGS